MMRALVFISVNPVPTGLYIKGEHDFYLIWFVLL